MTVFVTFRQFDSLPPEVVDRYEQARISLRSAIEKDPKNPLFVRDAIRLFTHHIDRCLDSGCGSCWLRRAEAGQLVLEAFKFFDGDRYRLHSVVVMPNHAHALLTLNPDWEFSRVMHSLKSYTGHKLTKNPAAPNPFWQDESYDHIVRNEGDLWSLLKYVARNPEKARLKDWPFYYISEEAAALMATSP